MSGGRFDYMSWRFKDVADRIRDIIEYNNSKELNEWGESFGYGFTEETIEEFIKGVQHMELAAIYEHRIDWLVSGDDGEEGFHKRLQEDLKGYKLEDVRSNYNVPELIFQKTEDCPDCVQLPEYKTFLAAAFDLQASKNTTILPNSKEVIGTGLRVLIPEGYYARIESRSGLSAKFSIEKGAGIIDADYCDEWKIILHNHSNKPFHIIAGDRVAQAIVAPCVQACLKWGEVPDRHPMSNRSGGLGSTGV